MTKLEVTRNGKCAGAASGTCSQSFFYSWDEVGRLVRARRWDQASVPANPVTTAPAVDLQYHYAAGDSRVLKTARAPNTPEVHTAYIFPGLELRRAQFNVATAGDYTLDSSTEVAYLFANGVRLARLVHQPVTSAGDGVLLRVFFELGDHLGSNSVALDKASGELVERSTYQVYGGAESSYRPSKWGDFREDYRFTGKEEDVEVGLTYFGKRFYNALLQRWVSPDPLEVHLPGEADANLYAYVVGMALKAVDPLGLQDESTTPPPAAGQDVPPPPVPGSPEAARAEARSAAEAAGQENGRIDAELMLGARALRERHVDGTVTVQDSICSSGECHPLSMTIPVDTAPTAEERFARYTEAVVDMTARLESSRPAIPTDPELKQIHDRHRTATAVGAIFDGFKDQLAASMPLGRGSPRSGSPSKGTPNRIGSTRELLRRAEEPGPMHNFPESFNGSIFAGQRTVVSEKYVLYTQRGTIQIPGRPIYGKGTTKIGNETVQEIIGYTPTRTVSGTYEIGVRPSASGRTEVITHRFFRPD